MLITNEETTFTRISDLSAVVPAVTGKVELVYEGEQEGSTKVAHNLIGKAIRSQFTYYFPNPEDSKKRQDILPYQKIINWFASWNKIDLLLDDKTLQYEKRLLTVPGLKDLVKTYHPVSDHETFLLFMEFVLFGLAEYSFLAKHHLEHAIQFKDLFSSMFTLFGGEEEDSDLESYS
jgi:magnesium chelatase subunit I